MTDSLRVAVEVVAGLVPGKDPDPEFTRQWGLSSRAWMDAVTRQQAGLALEALNDQALEYARSLMMRPDRLNWVRVDWIWL